MVLLAGCPKGGASGSGGAVELKTDDQKILYALGLMMGRNVASFNLTQPELDLVKKGLTDSVNGTKPAIEMEQYFPKISQLQRTRQSAKSDAEKEKAKPFLESAAKEPGAEKTASGLVFKTIKPGTGDSPKATDRVKVHYHGTLMDGTVFDSSVQRGEPAEFPLNGVVPCWTEGVQKMKVGEKAKLVCPSSIAYGDRGHPPKIPGGATLIFEIELLEIKKQEAVPPTMHPGMPGMGMPGMPPGIHPPPPGGPHAGPPGAPGAPAPGAPGSPGHPLPTTKSNAPKPATK